MAQEKPRERELKSLLIGNIWGIIRPIVRGQIEKLVERLPEETKGPVTETLTSIVAQNIERIKGINPEIGEILSDVLEMISTAAGKPREVRKPEIKAVVDQTVSQILSQHLTEINKRLKEAENIENEKNRVVAELNALNEILRAFQKIANRFIPQEKRKEIEWDRVFNEIGKFTKIVGERGVEGLKELDQKAGKLADKIEEKRRQIREEEERKREQSLWRRLKRRLGR